MSLQSPEETIPNNNNNSLSNNNSGTGGMKSFSKNSIKRGFFPEGAFNVRVAASDPAMGKQLPEIDDGEQAMEVVAQAPASDHSSAPPSASKNNKPPSSSSSSSSCSSRALFTFPSKWDDAEKWLKSSKSAGGSNNRKYQQQLQIHGFKKLVTQQNLIGGADEDHGFEEYDEEESSDKEKKMMIDSASSGAVSALMSRFSFPMMGKNSSAPTVPEQLETICEDKGIKNHLRIQKPSTDLSDMCFDFKQAEQQQQQQQSIQPKSPTSLYESVACIAPGSRSICMRDMGTEMTPIASQEPSRTGTPLRTPTMRSPGVSPGRLRPIPPPPQNPSRTIAVIDAAVGDSSPIATPVNAHQDHHTPPAVSTPQSGSSAPASASKTNTIAKNATRHEIMVLGTQLGKNSIAAWATREEEEEDASKCLKVVVQQQQQQNQQQQIVVEGGKLSTSSNGSQVDLGEVRRTMVESRAAAWEEAEQAKYMARYEREEAKIIAWENHQKAKAEAELRRMEVKVERMRSHAHERMMNKLAAARRRAEELRAAAEAKRGEKAAKTAEKAGEIRRNGRVSSSSTPSHLFRCCLAGV